MRKTNLTKEEARELIKYDFESGRAWQQRRDRKWFKTQRAYSTWNTCHAGKEITSDNGNGYYQVILLGEKFLLHRVIWLYVTGEWPKGDIDHINGIKTLLYNRPLSY